MRDCPPLTMVCGLQSGLVAMANNSGCGRRVGVLLGLLSGVACQSLEAPPEARPFTGVRDTRAPIVKADTPPPPVDGGTLLALSDRRRVVVSDRDRNRILVVDFESDLVARSHQLEPGSRPGRAAQDATGRVFVVLEGSGELVTLEANSFDLGERRAVCSLPRGLSLARDGEHLLVACGEGKLVELNLTGKARKEAAVPLDVRDVLVTPKQLYLSRFRSAELVKLEQDRSVGAVQPLPAVGEDVLPNVGESEALFTAGVAWRAVPRADGAVVVAHQRVLSEPLTQKPDEANFGDDSAPIMPYYGSAQPKSCGGIVHTGVTIMHPDGTMTTSPQLGGMVLPVDVAVSVNGLVAVASPGVRDPGAPNGNTATPSVWVLKPADFSRATVGKCLRQNPFDGRMHVTDPAVGVAFVPQTDRLLVHLREPARLALVEPTGTQNLRFVTLGGEDVTDTGHDLFHRDTGTGIACASCHPGGSEDGHTWLFVKDQPRRTQPIDIELMGTEPFHWDGDVPTLGSLMHEVFSGRMAGAHQAPERVEALSTWLNHQRPRAPLRAATDAAATRGRTLFASTAGCATCHAGPKFMKSGNFDVGTGGKFQVPSLRGVAHRLPVMHDGCARTLTERFERSCGGDRHGNVAQLTPSEIADLVAYLETL